VKIVHYLNQFFAGFGAEESASMAPQRIQGPVGPGRALGFEVAATLACGDDYFGEAEDHAVAELLRLLQAEAPDALVLGPAFGSGRYGYACGVLAREASRRGVPSVTGMEPDNPGVAAAEGWAYIVPTTDTVIGMRPALAAMADLVRQLADGQPLSREAGAAFMPRQLRLNRQAQDSGAARAVALLLAKLEGETRTEILPRTVPVEPPEPLADLSTATIAIVTESGCVPMGNPDRLTSRRSHTWLRYPLDGVERLDADAFETIHGGYDRTAGNADPNRLVPIDALRMLEHEGAFGRLHPFLYTTSGVDTSVANSIRFGQEIGAELIAASVDAVVLTGT
jgi:glycine reductase complex component B subunit gamma